MHLGYNTNGLTGHRWPEVLDLLAEIGYTSVAITVDHFCLDPWSPRLREEIDAVRARLEKLGMISVVETGARFLLNPRVKHEPTLVSPSPEGRAVRVDFLRRCIDIAHELGSEAVSFWAGVLRDDASRSEAFDRLAERLRPVIDYAGEQNVRLAFEPEPGMLIATMDDYAELLERIDGPQFGLTIDVGHVQCVEDEPIPVHLRRWANRLYNVHIEDMRRGVHEHLRFGEGEIDFPPVVAALAEIGYTGGVNVELSRHSHMAPEVLRESYDFLSALIPGAPQSSSGGLNHGDTETRRREGESGRVGEGETE